jgi:lysophospholipase L1-like esterase
MTDFTPITSIYPKKSNLVLMGHSYLAYNSSSDASFTAAGNGTGVTYTRGYVEQANAIAGQPFQIISNQGVSGATSTQILAQIPPVLALNPAAIMLHSVSNDVYSGITVATTISNLTQIFQSFINANVTIIFGVDFPRSSEGGTALRDRGAIYNFVKEFARKNHGIYIFNANDILLDNSSYANSYNNTPKTNLFLNEAGSYIHLNSQGANLIAQRLANILLEICPVPIRYTPSCNTDGNTNGDSTCLSANPFCIGAGGAFGAGMSGALPNGYYGQRYSGAVTGVASVVARSVAASVIGFPFNDGGGDNVIKIAATGATAVSDYLGVAWFSANSQTASSGQYIVECELGVNVTSGTINRADIVITNSTAFTTHCRVNVMADANDYILASGIYKRVLRSRPFFLNNSAAATISCLLNIGGSSGGSFDAYIGRPVIYKA